MDRLKRAYIAWCKLWNGTCATEGCDNPALHLYFWCNSHFDQEWRRRVREIEDREREQRIREMQEAIERAKCE